MFNRQKNTLKKRKKKEKRRTFPSYMKVSKSNTGSSDQKKSHKTPPNQARKRKPQLKINRDSHKQGIHMILNYPCDH